MNKKKITIVIAILNILILLFYNVYSVTYDSDENSWKGRLAFGSLTNGSNYSISEDNAKYTVEGVTVSTGEATKVTAINSNATSIKIYDKLSYNYNRDVICQTRDISELGGKLTTMDIDEDLSDRLFYALNSNNAVSLPDYSSKTSLPTAIQNSYTAAGSSACTVSKDNNTMYLWKSSSFDATNNKSVTNINFYQTIKNQPNYDFIFVIDNSIPYPHRSSSFPYNMLATVSIRANSADYQVSRPQVVRMYISEYVDGLFANSNLYDNKVAFITYTNNDAQTGTYGYYNSASAAKTALQGTYIGDTIPSTTNYANGLNAAITKAQESKNAGRTPFVIFLAGRDCADSSDAITAATQLKNYADVYSFAAFETNLGDGTLKTISSDNTVHTFNTTTDMGGFITNIVKDEMGYYVGNGTKVNDEIYSTLDNLSNKTNTTQTGTSSYTNGTVTWNVDKQSNNTRLESGNLLTCTVGVPLNPNVVYSGSMPTNEDCSLVDINNTELTKIAAANSPVLGKDLQIKLKSDRGVAIPNAQFKLTVGTDTYTYTTDANGIITIPYSTVKMTQGQTVTLKQDTTGDNLKVPSGEWNLSVNANYTIGATTTQGSGNETLDLGIENGMFVVTDKVENRLFITDFGQAQYGSDPTEPLANAQMILSTDSTFQDNSKIVSTQTTDSSGKVVIEKPGAGTYYLKQSNVPSSYYENDGYWAITIDDNLVVTNIQASNQFMPTFSGTNNNYTATNMLKWQNELTLSNKIDGDYSNLSKIFHYRITIKDENDNAIEHIQLTCTQGSQSTNFENGGVVSLANNGSIVVKDLKEGWKYEITDAEENSRYTLTYEINNDGDNPVKDDSVSGVIGTSNSAKAIRTTRSVPETGIEDFEGNNNTIVMIPIIGIVVAIFCIVISRKTVLTGTSKSKRRKRAKARHAK